MEAEDAKRRHAGSFGAAAEAYERGRPSYPAAALDWLLPPDAARVLDLGAGTGKLTRALAARRTLAGHPLDIMAVEPAEAMRDVLRLALPEVVVLDGAAERIPLDAGSVDAVLVAQAWHWVDPVRAVPEVARVLKPGGRFGLLWNCRDEGEGWMRALGAILHRIGFMEDRSRDPPVGPPFGPVERHDVPWAASVTAEGVLDLVRSRSYVIVLPPREAEAVLDEVRAVLAGEPGFADGGRVAMPYVTRCSRATLPSAVSKDPRPFAVRAEPHRH